MRANHLPRAFAQANLARTLDPEDSALAGSSGSDHRRGTHGRWIRQGSTLVVLDFEPVAPAPPRSRRAFDIGFEAETGTTARPTLRRGSTGSAVRELQSALQRAGHNPGTVDGIFGSQTEAAVRSFQAAQSLTVDGIVGAQTWGRLLSATPGTPSSGVPAASWVLPADVRAAGEAQFVRYDSPPQWANGTNCTTSFTPGAAELGDYIRATFPGVTAVGGYACRQNTANPSETSVHGVGRAIDIMIPPIGTRGNSAVGDPIANWLVRNAAVIGVQYIIWNRTQWSGSRSGRKDRPYTGPNPHIDHIHAELNRDGATRSTPWF
jgi:hypothetical protein